PRRSMAGRPINVMLFSQKLFSPAASLHLQTGSADERPLPLDPDATGTAAHTRMVRRSLGIVTLGWVFGSVWMNSTSGAPLTLFAKGLGATPFQFGLLAALPFIASLVSMPASLLIERTGRRKGIFLNRLSTQRLMWF